MTTVFPQACLCAAVGCFATVTDVGYSIPTLLTTEMAQVVCDIVTLATGSCEHGFCDMLEAITQASRFVAVCLCSARADVRTNGPASPPRVLNMGQVVVTTTATATRAGVPEIQMYVLQVSAQVLIGVEAPVALDSKQRQGPEPASRCMSATCCKVFLTLKNSRWHFLQWSWLGEGCELGEVGDQAED